MAKTVFDPITLGRIELANRIVMAPMTRSRAGEGDLVSDLHVSYYSQRAGAGLIITEGVQPSKNGKGYCRTPGIYNEQQVTAWKKVTDAVHAQGGKIVLQLMHCGRVAGSSNKDADAETVAPSAITCKEEIFTETGMQPMVEPRALRTDEIPSVIEEYRQATVNAYAAGFDGVELHCTSGYLPAQFLSTGTNQRDDQYGGSLENRLRFVLEVLEAINSVDGADRVGMRISPGNPFNDLFDDDPEETFSALLAAVDKLGLAYLHVIRMPQGGVDNLALAKRQFHGNLMINDSYSLEEANAAIDGGEGDLVSFGRLFISNPDLAQRFKVGAQLARLDPATMYTPGAEGFIDYPAL
jgi:N-ethylmaleimide reductase